MMSLLIALVLAAPQDLPVSLAAEPMPWGTEMPLVRGPLGRHAVGSIGLYGRVSFPSETDVTVDGVTWADLFDEGWGASVEADVSAVIDRGFAVGAYISVGWDQFDGRTDVDSFGDSVHPDPMEMITVIAGAKSTGWIDNVFFWEGRMGLGLVHYRQVLADFRVAGVLSPDQEFFKESDRVVFEMGGRIGIGTPSFAVVFGMGFRIMGPPARGSDVTTFVDPDILTTFIMDLGVMIRF